MLLCHFLRRAAGVGTLSLANRLIGFATGVVLARYLGPEGYGSYAFVFAMVLLLLIPAKLGLPTLVLREIAAARSDPHRADPATLFWRAALVMLGTSVLSGLVLWLAGPLLLSSSPAGTADAFALGALLLPALTLLTLCTYSLRALNRVVLGHALWEVLPPAVALVLVLIAVQTQWFGQEVSMALGARLAGAVLSLAIAGRLVFRLLRAVQPTTRPKAVPLRQLISTALPFVLLEGGNIVMSRTDVLMLGALVDPHSVGIYNAALQAALLVPFALQVSNTVTAPDFSRLHAAGDLAELEAFAISTARLIAVGGLLCGGIFIIFGGELLGLAFGEPYRMGATPLAILAAGQAISLCFGAPVLLLNMTGKQVVALRLVLMTATANVVLNAVLIPIFGMNGAAIATAICLIIWKAAAAIHLRRHLGINCVAFARQRSRS